MGASGFVSGAVGAFPDDFVGRGRIKVERKGRYHPVYTLKMNGDVVAELCWRGPRRAIYTCVGTGERFEMRVGPMKRKIKGVDADGRMSRLVVSSNRDLARRELRAQMCTGENFVVRRSTNERWGSTRFEIRKQHYVNNLLVFKFDEKDPDAKIVVDVERLMKWEHAHLHRLLALVTARIGLERRMDGRC